MKRVMSGMRYDTDKAIKIGDFGHGCYPGSGDFSHWTAALYKTPRSGRFFLAGEGGPMTVFAKHSPHGGSCGGEKLIPMSKEDALDWAERYLDVEDTEKHFDIMDA